jgi:hypothetical protein
MTFDLCIIVMRYPTDDPSRVKERRQAFNEHQYMLEAFLAFNQTFTVQLANAWMWHEERELLTSSMRCPSG